MTRGCIDLNGDVGEGSLNEAALIPLLTSASIACGGHAGDERSMTEAVLRAFQAGVAVGAHPSFPDRENFGRRELPVTGSEVRGWITGQVEALRIVIDRLKIGVGLRHVKLHGALYNLAARQRALAEDVVETVQAIDPSLILFALAGSELEVVARKSGLRVAAEGFIDRAYLSDGRLATREKPGAVIDDEEIAIRQALRLARGEPIEALDGGPVCPRVDTLCLHGDGPYAVVFATKLRECLTTEGIAVRMVQV